MTVNDYWVNPMPEAKGKKKRKVKDKKVLIMLINPWTTMTWHHFLRSHCKLWFIVHKGIIILDTHRMCFKTRLK